jgi:hypothetical protein
MGDLDLFADTDYGKRGYAKLKDKPEGFRFYSAERLGKPPMYSDTIKLIGAVFREAKSGVNKGQKVIKVKDTEIEVYVTDDE